MKIAFPTQQIKEQFEQCILRGWHEAHGPDAGCVFSYWGGTRVVIMIEDVLFKGERLLTHSEQGNSVLEKYVKELMGYVAKEQAEALQLLLQRPISSTSLMVNAPERWVMFIFRLGETDEFS